MGMIDILVPLCWFAYFTIMGMVVIELAAKKTWLCLQCQFWDYVLMGMFLMAIPVIASAAALYVAIQGVSDGK